jgi:hypothetical protein
VARNGDETRESHRADVHQYRQHTARFDASEAPPFLLIR